MAGLARRSPGADEAALARHAAAGDGEAFAELYERYEGRVFNLCYRILGSRDDAADATQEAFVGVLRRLPKLAGRDLAFGSYVLTSARNASYDLIERGKRAQPTEEIPEAAGPVGGGFDPGDPEDDPERNMLLEARTEEIRAANLTLPERQREVLALRELEELSYDEIAEIMDMNRNSVAQLISRARINLRDALRGTALASIAAGSPDCERALPLIALEQDGQLDEDSNEAGWLGEHLMRCHQCRLGRDAMQEAGVSYRAWLPIAAGPLLFRETMAQAAEHVGADWSETIARREARRGAAAGAGARGAAFLRHRRRNLVAAGVLAFVLALVVLVGASSDDDPVGTVVPAAEEAPAEAAEEPAAASEKAAAEKAAARRQRRARRERIRRRRAAARAAEEPAEPVAAPPVEPVPVAPEPEAEPQRRRPRPRPRPERRNEGGGQRRPAPEVTPEPPPAPTPTVPAPPPPPPTETTPAPPPPQPPPPSCTPSPNCPPPPGP